MLKFRSRWVWYSAYGTDYREYSRVLCLGGKFPCCVSSQWSRVKLLWARQWIPRTCTKNLQVAALSHPSHTILAPICTFSPYRWWRASEPWWSWVGLAFLEFYIDVLSSWWSQRQHSSWFWQQITFLLPSLSPSSRHSVLPSLFFHMSQTTGRKCPQFGTSYWAHPQIREGKWLIFIFLSSFFSLRDSLW